MRFELHPTTDGSLTVFDREVGECFKSRHAARTEAEHVFYRPAVLEHPAYSTAANFEVLELGFGLGTNFLYFLERGFRGTFRSIERDLSGAEFFLQHEANDSLASLVQTKAFHKSPMRAFLHTGDFHHELRRLIDSSYRAHAVLFDPFSPKANPLAWTSELFSLAREILHPGGRLVTYSVSRTAKDAAVAAGLRIEKHKLPPELNKRSALLATKPVS